MELCRAGGSYQFSFENARSARNYGVEIDLRKSLAFIGMNNFMLTLNAAWIESKVLFGEQSREHDRPMQGQSPYLVNAGLFYQNGRIGFAAGILYNRIGKRSSASAGSARAEATRSTAISRTCTRCRATRSI